ncbi:MULTISPECIES: ABC transporter substrate-binding protein [unclassified Bradyrhizobium]|uniref:ABC transporter substrate-binding protein n=1 Tax=unclassified Bradyrhizobium TaxID=2631580 RepID=UPI00244945C4|nr:MULTISPECIES: ABC transporter substrate-binding protein [unclassified Bradyrhizobium]MDH2344122.1 ABC transporter substrate-binding protein [Bradyrhizobium sp. SSUT77]MDH2350286.1 ABC transporter substrate-binding protein [Bradyrhizobium sp. SSUT112]
MKSIRDSEDPKVQISHFSHTLPGLFREGGNIPAIWARSTGRDTVVVALTWVDEFQAILVRKDSPIEQLSDLAGRVIGVPRQAGERVDFARAMSLRGIVTALDLAGLSTDDVTLRDIESVQPAFAAASVGNGRFHELEAKALEEGVVDAIYAKGAPGLGSARQHGFRVLIDIGSHRDPTRRINNGNPRPVTVDRRTAELRPDIVARYLTVLICAAEWARDNPDPVFDIIGQEVGRTADEARGAYGARAHFNFGLDLSPLRRRSLTAQKDFLLRHGFIPTDFDVESWIDPRPLALATGRREA